MDNIKTDLKEGQYVVRIGSIEQSTSMATLNLLLLLPKLIKVT
jgi:hypothetical protein